MRTREGSHVVVSGGEGGGDDGVDAGIEDLKEMWQLR